MSKRQSERFPWHRLQKGEYFFVPALDVAAVELRGLREAAKQGITAAKATPCIHRGLLGVMFKR